MVVPAAPGTLPLAKADSSSLPDVSGGRHEHGNAGCRSRVDAASSGGGGGGVGGGARSGSASSLAKSGSSRSFVSPVSAAGASTPGSRRQSRTGGRCESVSSGVATAAAAAALLARTSLAGSADQSDVVALVNSAAFRNMYAKHKATWGSRARPVEPPVAPRLDHHPVDVPDCVLLEPLSEDALITNLLARFKRDQIYTYIGDVLLSVNPYKPLAQYTELAIEGYKRRSLLGPPLPPHVYALADNAWRAVRDLYADQAIVITGESGSGKTEASKLILQYIATAAGHSRCLETVRQQILLCNPVLEAFGNAKTVLNDNSSRFGKYIELEFDYRGEPVGGYITHYLLEKSRVTVQHPGERNFHIFYQLLAGADVQLLKSLKLQRNTENYLYLRSPQANVLTCDQSDKDEFINTKKALESVGFCGEEIVNILRIVSVVLKLGNLIFSPVSNIDGTEGCSIDNEYELEEVAALLAIPLDDLRSALLYRTLTVGCPAMTVESNVASMAVPSRPSDAGGVNCFSRDSTLQRRESTLPRTFASNNFHQSPPSHPPPSHHYPLHQPRTSVLSSSASIVGRGDAPFPCQNMYQMMDGCPSEVGSYQATMSRAYQDIKEDVVMTDLSAAEATSARDALCKALYCRLFTWIVSSINERMRVKVHGKRRVLAILDVYGFENLATNGFEQLVINYCNEKLHQHVNDVALKDEQEDNVHEGLEWCPVPFVDNSAVCDLLDKCNLSLLSLLDEECLRVGHASDDTFVSKLGQVYHDSPLLEITTGPASKCGEPSTLNAFRIQHFAGWVTYNSAGFLDKNNDLLVRGLSQSMYQCGHPIVKELFPEGNPRRTTFKRPATAATQFKVSLNALMKSLKSKSAHFVRCIKPNAVKQPHHFELNLVQHQVAYLGLVATARVKRSSFFFRQPYAGFLQRYKMLSAVTWPHWSGVSIEGVARLLRDLPISATEYAFGRRKLFIKNTHTVAQLEDFRQIRIDELAVLIQKTFRAWSARMHFLRMKDAQVKIANAWRRFKARREYLELRQRRRMAEAVQIIQRVYIAWKRRRYLNRLAVRLPSTSPTCRDWPYVTPFLRDTNQLLKKLYHKWRCHRYRLMFDQIGRNRMREKVTASFLFKNRKESYARSVAHPFQGDYVRLRQNTQWRKMVQDTVDHYIVFADIVSKITRSTGRLNPVLFVLSTSSMMIMDQRTLNIKYRVPAADVIRISLSPFLDDIAVFHIKSLDDTASSVQNLQTGCLTFQSSSSDSPAVGQRWKGDLVLQTCHVMELVTKMFLVVQNASGKAPEVNVHTDFEVSVGHQLVEFSFRCMSLPDVQPGQVRIIRRGPRLEVTL